MDDSRFLAPAQYMIDNFKSVNTLTTIKPSTEEMDLTCGEVIPDFEVDNTFVLEEYKAFLDELRKERDE